MFTSRRIESGRAAFLGAAVAVASLLSSSAGAVVVSGPAGTALADPSEWSSVLLLSFGSAHCSTVVVGPQALLTAGHCVADQPAEIQVSLHAAAGRIGYRMNCRTDPRHPQSAGADLALCKTDQPLLVSRIERIGSSPLPANSELTLVGYGCRDASTGNFDGRLSAGKSNLQPPAAGSTADAAAQTLGAAACRGDGGGGAFLAATGDAQARLLGGVISRINAAPRSSVALVGNESFLRFAREWSAAVGAPICGLGAAPADGCAPQPEGAPAASDASGPLPRGTASLAGPTTAPTIAANQPGRANSNDVPLRQVFLRKGEVLSEAIQLSCRGTADEPYLAAVLAHLERNGERLERDHVFRASRTLTIPICPVGTPRETIVLTVMSAGPKRLYDYFLKLTEDKVLGGRWLFEHRPERDGPRETPEGPNSRYFVDVFKTLNPTQNPRALTPGDIRLPLRPQTIATRNEPGANIETVEAFNAVQTPDEACSKSQDELTYPYDLVGLLDTLNANARNRTALPGQARIVILDSGLYVRQRDETVFRRTLYLDGLNLEAATKLKRLEGQTPLLPKSTDAAHGTHVASVALGGPLFARIRGVTDDNPRIRVDPYRVKESRDGIVVMPADRIPEIFEQLQPRGTVIVNLSFGANSTITPVKSRLGDTGPDFLFVVAAGNSNNALGQKIRGGESIHVHFPASYGGPDNLGEANLITVAALYREEGAWKRAAFSDHGAKFVELGAPGCSVPVIHFDRDAEAWAAQSQRQNGTSFAAPLVSFTAALVSTERPDLSAAAIKSRILAAADLNPGLVADVADGRSLNTVKAVAVTQDVLQKEAQILRGSLELRPASAEAPLGPDDPFPVPCNGVSDLKVRDVVKVVPSFNTAIKSAVPSFYTPIQSAVATLFPDVVYALVGEKRKLKRLDCALSEDDVTVHFRREGTVGFAAYQWNEIRDLVPRLR